MYVVLGAGVHKPAFPPGLHVRGVHLVLPRSRVASGAAAAAANAREQLQANVATTSRLGRTREAGTVTGRRGDYVTRKS